MQVCRNGRQPKLSSKVEKMSYIHIKKESFINGKCANDDGIWNFDMPLKDNLFLFDLSESYKNRNLKIINKKKRVSSGSPEDNLHSVSSVERRRQLKKSATVHPRKSTSLQTRSRRSVRSAIRSKSCVEYKQLPKERMKKVKKIILGKSV